jgi:hypothetical protein
MSDPQVIYLSAPNCVRTTDRYEQFYYLLSHRYAGCEILEARELFPSVRGTFGKAWYERWKRRFHRRHDAFYQAIVSRG